MGYANYYQVLRQYDEAVFAKIADDFKKCIKPLADMGVKLAGPDGSNKPIITNNEILFNGRRSENKSSEPFILRRQLDNYELNQMKNAGAFDIKYEKDFGYGQKTRLLSYDIAVKTCLVIAKHRLGNDIKTEELTEDADDCNDNWDNAYMVLEKAGFK